MTFFNPYIIYHKKADVNRFLGINFGWQHFDGGIRGNASLTGVIDTARNVIYTDKNVENSAFGRSFQIIRKEIKA